MKKKIIKILAVSTLLSLTMGCVAFADAKQNKAMETGQVQQINAESKITKEGQKSCKCGSGNIHDESFER